MHPEKLRHFIVATAGHVDHGKSALVQALTGTDPDRLPEEKARGITIDLGFAHLQLPAAEAAGIFDLGIIDVPGHEDFVRNMVAGAGSIDLALLVVAADDGWMPQTVEHLQILTYLGVQRAVVVLTKIDLAASDEGARVALIRERLRGSRFEQAPVVPTSVITGRGLEALRANLAQELACVTPPRDVGKPRLQVDRAFALQGIGTVVTGTLRGGCLHAGQEVCVQPAGIATRIRTIQTHNRAVASVGPGTRAALNLAGVFPDASHRSGAGDMAVRRGCVITLPGLCHAHDVVEVLLERSPRLAAEPAGVARPLRDGMRVRFHTGSGNVPGRLHFLNRQELGPGERCLAQIRLEAPVSAFVGDRFVLRDWTERLTLAGGIVVDPCARRKTRLAFGGPSFAPPIAFSPFAHQACDPAFMLKSSAPLALTPQWALARHLQSHRVLSKATLLVQSNFSPAEIAEALDQLSAPGHCVLAGDCVLEMRDWKALLERAGALIDACHKTHPEQTGLSLGELRSALSAAPGRGLPSQAQAQAPRPAAPRLPAPEVFEPLLAELVRSDFALAGSVIQRSGYRPQLPPPLQPAGARIRSALALKPLDPPARKELTPDRASQEALAFLMRASEVVELGPEVVLASAAFGQALESIRRYLRQHGSGTVSELRQALGASRRVVVPLLEKLDRQGLTRREGDKRVLKA